MKFDMKVLVKIPVLLCYCLLCICFLQYLDKIGVAYFGQPASASSGEGQASGGAGLMDLFGGGGTGRGLLGK